MEREKLLKKYRDYLADKPLIAKNITRVNAEPHSYVIGPRHIKYASDNFGGRLSEDAIRAAERNGRAKCEYPGCNLPYDDHTAGQLVIFLALKRNLTQGEAQPIFDELGKMLQRDNIDGLVMVETPEKYRIL